MTPLVSVIVPAWNAESTIGATLRSVAAQTYRKLEIIIVDDGSTDGTAAVAEAFCASQPRARLIRKANGGVASARNRGIFEAKGEWLAPIDADDLWHPAKIEKQVAAAVAAREAPGFVYCWRRLIDRDDRVVASGLRTVLEGSAFNRLAYVNAVECGSSLLLSRQAAIEVGGYEESLRARAAQGCEDMLLQLKVARILPVAAVREHLVAWRLHDSNMSSDFDQMARSCSLVFADLAAQGTPVPPGVVRRAMAKIHFELAEERAARGKAGMLGSLALAIALDPVRSAVLIGYRGARMALRRLRPRPERALPRFQDVDPEAAIADPTRIRWFADLLEGMEERRLARLASSEPDLPERAPVRASAAAR